MSVSNLNNNGGTLASMLPWKEYNARVVNIANEVGNRIQDNIRHRELVKKIVSDKLDEKISKVDTYA